MLQAEISTVYNKDGRVRKVHHVVYAPDFASARRLIESLEQAGLAWLRRPPHPETRFPRLAGNSAKLGRRMLPLVPAHIWTPWFGVLGSKSGFDSIEECYGDLSPEIFAVETGLSADPATNWLVSALDRYASVSNSDAHSPAKLGRKATVFDTKMDYFSMFQVLKKGTGPICRHQPKVGHGPKAGTDAQRWSLHKLDLSPFSAKAFWAPWNSFPKRAGIITTDIASAACVLRPRNPDKCKGKCPVCGKPLTLGVMHRVSQLADRPHPSPSATDIALMARAWCPCNAPKITGRCSCHRTHRATG